MAVIIDGTSGVSTPGVTDTGNLSVAGSTTLTTPLPVASGGTGATSLSGIAVGNLTGGSAGTIPYQSTVGTTAMLATGTSGQVLTSAGALAAPVWASAPSPAGGATVTSPMSSNVTLTSSSNKVQVLTPDAFNRQVILPDATTISAAGGPIFVLQNTNSWYPIAIMDSAGNNVGWVVSDYQSQVYLTSTASATGNWVIKTGNPSADAGIYPYGSTYLSSNATTAQYTQCAVANADGTVVVLSPNGTSEYVWSFDTRANGPNGYVGSATFANPTTPDSGYSVAMVALSSGTVIVFYYTGGGYNCFALTTDSSGNITKGSEISLSGSAYGVGYFCCSPIDSTHALVTYGAGGTGYVQAQIVAVSGTTCTAGTAVQVVAATTSPTSTKCAALSSTLAHVTHASTLYDLTLNVSTNAITVNNNVSLGATAYGVCANTSTSSIVFYNNGSSQVIAKVATSSGGTPTLGTASSVLCSASYVAVSQIKAGQALLMNGQSANGIVQPLFTRVGVSSGVPVLLGQGPAPAAAFASYYLVQPKNGLGMMMNVSGVYSNNGNTFRKFAITGGI